ncbi:hypothetical protein LTR01_008986 [Friedmanniomyces endolithicus]|nr:hypothetical protein LTR01_008986 [Friedmanniomyces endolithicus]KAK0822808.1 hypothetical protein LTR73_009020 [Friedmanniomyces endolithicus]
MALFSRNPEELDSLEKQWESLKVKEDCRQKLVELSAHNDTVRTEVENLKFHERNYLKELKTLAEECKSYEGRLEGAPFVAVLVDGDNTLFLDDFVKDGTSGGERAAKKLREAIQGYIKNLFNAPPHWKVVVRIYINKHGLVDTYTRSSTVSVTRTVEQFIVGFNHELPLFEFVDAGADREAADNKIKENLALYWADGQCKQILLAGSADRGYVGPLRTYRAEVKLTTKLVLVESVPFPRDFKELADWFHTTSFKDVFRGSKLATQLIYRARKLELRRHSAFR